MNDEMEKILNVGTQRALELFNLDYSTPTYSCHLVHYLLGQGIEVFGTFKGPKQGEFEMHAKKYNWSTRKAYLVGMTPIEEDSPLQILQAMVNCYEHNEPGELSQAVDRAKDFLAKKKKQNAST